MKNQKEEKVKTLIKVGVVICRDNEVLLIREKNRKTQEYKWNIIKGTLENRIDQDLIAAAVREAYEEASVKIKVTGILNIMYLHELNKSIIMVTFLADLLRAYSFKSVAQPGVGGEHISEVCWFDKDGLEALGVEDFIGYRGYCAVQDFLNGKRVSLDAYRFVK